MVRKRGPAFADYQRRTLTRAGASSSSRLRGMFGHADGKEWGVSGYWMKPAG